VRDEALGAWWYVFPAKRSGGEQRLAPCEQHQVVLLQGIGVMRAMMCVIYKASKIP